MLKRSPIRFCLALTISATLCQSCGRNDEAARLEAEALKIHLGSETTTLAANGPALETVRVDTMSQPLLHMRLFGADSPFTQRQIPQKQDDTTSDSRMPARPESKSFTLQVASTESRAEADSLVNLWRVRGYEAYLSSTIYMDQTLYMVRIGQFRSNARAENVARHINSRYGATSYVIPSEE